MTGPDPQTIGVYDARAGEYATLYKGAAPWPDLTAFITALPPKAHVLDLGCGPGTASGFMLAAGHRPDALDASAGMVALANDRYPGIGARIATFDDVTGTALYDAAWVAFSLLHAPRADLPRYLGAIATALRPGGLAYFAMKTGNGAARDGIGRLYTYVTPATFTALLAAAGLTPLGLREDAERGLAGSVDPYFAVTARRGPPTESPPDA